MINGHHFHSPPEDGFHDSAATGREMIAQAIFPFCDSSCARDFPVADESLETVKGRIDLFGSTDAFDPEHPGSSAATEANRIVPTSKLTEIFVCSMLGLPLGLREAGCTMQPSRRRQ